MVNHINIFKCFFFLIYNFFGTFFAFELLISTLTSRNLDNYSWDNHEGNCSATSFLNLPFNPNLGGLFKGSFWGGGGGG